MATVDLIFSKRLKQAREDSGLTQEQLAEEVGVNKASISRYERHETTRLASSLINSIAKTLNVSTDWLLGKSKVKQNKHTNQTNKEERDFLEKARKLNSKGWDELKKQLDILESHPMFRSDDFLIAAHLEAEEDPDYDLVMEDAMDLMKIDKQNNEE